MLPSVKFIPLLFAVCLLPAIAIAAVTGTNTPSEGITEARIATLPPIEAAQWRGYLNRSIIAMQDDKADFASETPYARPYTPVKMSGKAADTMPLDRPAGWYGSAEARHIADVIITFQTPAGGWSKNMPRDGEMRQPAQPFAGNNDSRYPAAGDFDTPANEAWHYVGTIDNDATITELRFLAKVAAQTPEGRGDLYRESFARGLDYLFHAQFPNGGWPQVYPLEGGYHDAITYNDNAFVHAAELMQDVAEDAEFAFVDPIQRTQAREAAGRALDCVLATQVVVNGRRTIWGQQHDALTMHPSSARNYEPPALASSESAALLLWLMRLPDPSPEVQAAVHDGIGWLREVALGDVAWTDNGDKAAGRRLIAKPGAEPLWARYYDPATAKPVFGDRDKSLHDDVNDLSLERRNGYAWFNTAPKKALAVYDDWQKGYRQ